MQYTVITVSASILGDPVEQEDVDRYNALVEEDLVNAGLDNLYSVCASLGSGHADTIVEAWHDPELAEALKVAWERFCAGESANA